MKKEFSHTLDWEIISKYLSGEMTESELEVFEEELAVNPSYAEAIKASGKDLTRADLYLAKEAFDSEDAWFNVKNIITKNQESTPKLKIMKPSPFKTFMRVAATIIILFGIGLLAQTTYTNLYLNKTFVCEAGEANKSIVLEDGSIITLTGKYDQKQN